MRRDPYRDPGIVLKDEGDVEGLTIGPVWRRFEDGRMEPVRPGEWLDEEEATKIADLLGLPLFYV